MNILQMHERGNSHVIGDHGLLTIEMIGTGIKGTMTDRRGQDLGHLDTTTGEVTMNDNMNGN